MNSQNRVFFPRLGRSGPGQHGIHTCCVAELVVAFLTKTTCNNHVQDAFRSRNVVLACWNEAGKQLTFLKSDG